MTDATVPVDRPVRRRALAWSILDQGASSLTNILALVFAARVASVHGFAAFSSVYITYSLLLGASASYVGQALVLSTGSVEEIQRRCKSAALFVGLCSFALGLPLVAVMFLGGDLPRSFASLGIVLPIVLMQDALRYAFSVLRQPQRALLGDLTWLIVLVPVLAAQPDDTSPARLVFCWGLSCVPSLLVEMALLRRQLAGVRVDMSPYFSRGHLGRRFVIEFSSGNASSQLSVLGLGAVGTPLAIGSLRGATTLFGPINVLLNATSAFGPPLVLALPNAARRARATKQWAFIASFIAACWALGLFLLPSGVGRQILGDTWSRAHQIIPAIGAQYIATAAGTAAILALRSSQPRATLPIQVIFSGLAVAFMFTGYGLFGIQGAAWGLCLGSVAKAIALWSRVTQLAAVPGQQKVPPPREPLSGRLQSIAEQRKQP